MKPNITNDALKPIAIDDDDDDDVDSKTNEMQNELKETTKIKFVQHETEQHYHTPISFKNKLIMCFKSEPDLSRVQNTNKHSPMLNRGRFIAKKILSGVSMINLRRPFVNSCEKATITIESMRNDANNKETNAHVSVASPIVVTTENIESEPNTQMSIGVQPVIILNANKIDDDDEDFVDDEEVDREYDDSVDKENQSPLFQCKKIEYNATLKLPSSTNANSCGITLSDSISHDSVSPITKSTHRMSKAMQVRNCKITSLSSEDEFLKFFIPFFF